MVSLKRLLPIHLCVLLVLPLIASPASVRADPADFLGTWDVQTTLTAASDAVNPGYRAGDLRIDVWQIAGSAATPVLTTRDGSVVGVIEGDRAEFLAEQPLDTIVLMRLQVSAWLTSSRSMAGTILAEYWDTRFGYKIGLDAWRFEGVRR